MELREKQCEQTSWEQDFENFKRETEYLLQETNQIMQNQRAQKEECLKLELFNQQQELFKRRPSIREIIDFRYYARTCHIFDYFYNSLKMLMVSLDLLKNSSSRSGEK